jgi:hypothetical protein
MLVLNLDRSKAEAMKGVEAQDESPNYLILYKLRSNIRTQYPFMES